RRATGSSSGDVRARLETKRVLANWRVRGVWGQHRNLPTRRSDRRLSSGSAPSSTSRDRSMNFKNPIWLAIFAATLVLAACKNNAENSGEGAAAPAAEAAAEGGEAVAEVAAEGEAAVEAAGEAVEEAVGEVAGTGAAAPAAGEVAAAPTPVEVDPNFVATAESLHGTWAADFQSLLSGGDMSAEERAMMQAMLANATMEFTVTADA